MIPVLNLTQSEPTLRAATPDDIEPIATLWHRGWLDAHLGHVPESIRPHRRLVDFRKRVPHRIHETTVATIASCVVGFVTVHDDEVEQIYVAENARGGGAATALLRHAEQEIAARFDVGWLAVVAGNARARRFYARNGWCDAGDVDYAAQITSGTMLVPCRRYEKHMTRKAPIRAARLGGGQGIGKGCSGPRMEIPRIRAISRMPLPCIGRRAND